VDAAAAAASSTGGREVGVVGYGRVYIGGSTGPFVTGRNPRAIVRMDEIACWPYSSGRSGLAQARSSYWVMELRCSIGLYGPLLP
jgi:hypothetical protein